MPKSTGEIARSLSLELEIDQLRDELRAAHAAAKRHVEERAVFREKILRAASGTLCVRCSADVVEEEVRPLVLPQS